MKQNNDIQEELQMLNSKLGNISKEMPFTVPRHYFDELYGHVSLHTTKKHTAPHIVPEGYFDNLPEAMFERLKKELREEKPVTKRVSFNWRSISMAAAAVIIILISIGIYQQPHEQPLSATENLAQISDEKILAYMEDNIDDFDIELIKASLPNTTQEINFKEVDNTTINDYLYSID